MKHCLLSLLVTLVLGVGFAETTAPKTSASPSAYMFKHPEAKAAWRTGLPEDCVPVSPTCVYSKNQGTVYLLAEWTGLGKSYEVEFVLLGNLSDRAYEGLVIAWDSPSTVARAVEALGVPRGSPEQLLRGNPMAQGERFTITLKGLNDPVFHPLTADISDNCSTPAQALFSRGFPYIGKQVPDNQMPAAIIATYSGAKAIFGLPFAAEKGATYGLFRATTERPGGEPVIVALKWERLPKGMARVFHKQIHVTSASLEKPDSLLTELKALCDDPRDVFLDVLLDPSLPLRACVPLAKLLVTLEVQGGFTLTVSTSNPLPIRAFLPTTAWKEREKRIFQPWEVELSRDKTSGNVLEATLCQILEDWSGEGNDPALTRKCYPGVTPSTILEIMRRVDVNHGKVYVVFFYAGPNVTVGDLLPFANALREACPTQWVFTSSAP